MNANPTNKNPRDPLTVDVSLRFIGDDGMSTVDTPLPPIFYAIVGAGPNAVTNHSTLIHSAFGRKRLNESPAGKLPILHIGFRNPWSRYMQHGMGQLPYLLNLPGFKAANQIKATDTTVDGGLDSRVFAGAIDRQFADLRAAEQERCKDLRTAPLLKLQWPWMEGWVAHIQTRKMEPFTANLAAEEGGPGVASQIAQFVNVPYPNFPNVQLAPFRLLTVRRVDASWVAEFVYCQFVDFCTGTGRPRANVRPARTPEHKKALTPPWLDPASWTAVIGERRILSGMDAICDEVVWSAGERICVPKGGGIALNAAEKAVHNNCYLDWFDDKPLLPTFANPRNYTFLLHWNQNRARDVGEDEPNHPRLEDRDLIPFYNRGRLGKNAEVSEASLSSGGTKVKVTLAAKGVGLAQEALIRASNRQEATLVDGQWESTNDGGPPPSKEYDRLALPHGLDPAGIGQPKAIADHLGITSEINGDLDNRMVALGSSDASIRLLGAAAQVYPGFALGDYKPFADSDSPMARMWSYRATLPVSTVPDGFILSAVNIAIANQFFTKERPNTNINTLPLKDIEAILSDHTAMDYRELAAMIVAHRNPSNGYSDGNDLIAKLVSNSAKLANDARTAGEEKYVKDKVAPLRNAIDAELKAEVARLEKIKEDEADSLLKSTIYEQVDQLIKLAKDSAEIKKKYDVPAAETEAKIEFAKLPRLAERTATLVDQHKDMLRTVFSYAYTTVEI